MPQNAINLKLMIMKKSQNQSSIFSNKYITVSYSPTKCINAEKCAKGLSDVFRTSVIPWINLDGTSDIKAIVKQINQCPSGALQYELKKQYSKGA